MEKKGPNPVAMSVEAYGIDSPDAGWCGIAQVVITHNGKTKTERLVSSQVFPSEQAAVQRALDKAIHFLQTHKL